MSQSLPISEPPRHVAIILDGNGRWARKRGLPRIEGHRRGVNNVRAAVEACQPLGIKWLTLYAFSVENWKRPADEVSGLMDLLERFLRSELKTLHEHKVRLHTIGRVSELPAKVQGPLREAIENTRHYESQHLVLALNYGARTELADAVQKLAREVQAGRMKPEEVDYDAIARHLDTGGIPDPDLLIRTSGETRLSNFLLLQSAYAEMYFTPVAWPDFTKEDFAEAVAAYRRRERRFGLTGEQLATATRP